jgi:hypothetical protein
MVFKKLIIALTCLVGLSSCCCQYCSRDEADSFPTEWYLNNTTTETIVLDSPFGEGLRKLTTIPQKSDTLIDSFMSSDVDGAFDRLWYGAKDSVVIKLNGKVVRVWRESEKNNSGKQFFHESFWGKSIGIRGKKPCTIWTFELTPEDIETKNEL